MKFSYQYRTSDNVVHSGVIDAADRDAAFDLLKSSGVKPYGIAEVPGLYNKLLGKGKRWTAIVALAVLVALVGVKYVKASRTLRTMTEATAFAPRHQIYGDPSILEELESSGYSSVFAVAGERILAAYAQPGRLQAADMSVRPERAALIGASLTNEIRFVEGEPPEVAELKRIVNGIKEEMRECLSGGDTFESYLEQLDIRQENEANIYRRVFEELKGTEDDEVWEARNASLRAMGLQTVSRAVKGRKRGKSKK